MVEIYICSAITFVIGIAIGVMIGKISSHDDEYDSREEHLKVQLDQLDDMELEEIRQSLERNRLEIDKERHQLNEIIAQARRKSKVDSLRDNLENITETFSRHIEGWLNIGIVEMADEYKVKHPDATEDEIKGFWKGAYACAKKAGEYRETIN